MKCFRVTLEARREIVLEAKSKDDAEDRAIAVAKNDDVRPEWAAYLIHEVSESQESNA